MKLFNKKKNNTLLIIAGGIGKNILASAVVASAKAARPDHDITVMTAHPFAWTNNPHIIEAVNLNNSHTFFEEKKKNGEWTVYAHDPYGTESFIKREKHLIAAWCDLLGVPASVHDPKLYFTDEEFTAAKAKLPQDPRPLFFIQTNGGAAQQGISWSRDLSIVTTQKVVDVMNQAGYLCVHLRRNNQPKLENTLWINATERETMAMISFSDKRLFIDSFPQHAAAALGLPSVVTWVTNIPEQFGYPIHTNLRAKGLEAFRHHPENYLDLYDITGKLEQYPFVNAPDTLFSAEEIIKILLEK